MRKKLFGRILIAGMIFSMALSLIACGDTKTANTEEKDTNLVESSIINDKEEITPAVVKPTGSNAEIVKAMTASKRLVPTKHEKLWSIDAPVLSPVVQGGCVVDGYLYQGFIDANGDTELINKCVIQKIDINTGMVVKETEELQLAHTNDITYNSKLGCLVVIQNQPVANSIVCIDIDTLEVKDQFAIEHFMFAIDYHEETDQYVIGQTQGKTFRILDSEFNAISEVYKPDRVTDGATTQGMALDDDYIYFVFYKPNMIAVYDWDGNFVSVIELEEMYKANRYEPENISAINGEFYVVMKDTLTSKVTLIKLSDFVPAPEKENE